MYERVTIDRKNESVSVDRIDENYWHEKPFLGRRDLFYKNDENKFFFVRHDFWISKLLKFDV